MSGSLRVVAVGLVAHGERGGEPTFVVTKRRPDQHLGGSWELPGGRVEEGESPEEALSRELSEELGIAVTDLIPLTFSHHRYGGRAVLLLFFAARSLPGETPRPLAAEAMELLTLGEVIALPMPPANEPFKDLLRRFGAAALTPAVASGGEWTRDDRER